MVGVLASSGAVEARGFLRVDRERATQTLRLWSASSSSSSSSSPAVKAETKVQHSASVQDESESRPHDLVAADTALKAAGALTSPPQVDAAVSDAIYVVDAATGDVDIFVALGGEATYDPSEQQRRAS